MGHISKELIKKMIQALENEHGYDLYEPFKKYYNNRISH